MDYSCEKCGEVLCSRDALKQHYRNIHDTRYEDTLEDTEDCPTCGKSYETMQSVKIHHTKAHNESLSMIEVTCDWCGNTCERQESQIKDQQKTFCDQECHGAWESENMVGENHHNYNSVEVECDVCEETLTRAESEIHGHVFCGDDCMSEWLSNRVGENHPLYSRVEVDCEWCGETNVRGQAQVDSTENIFCSNECQSNWRSENWAGDANPMWEEGKRTYSGRVWTDKRQEAVERAGGTCEKPGCDRAESKHGSDLDVHHIIPWRLFDSNEEAHKLSNLLVLCKEHHMEIEPRYYSRDS